jgi:hypothetical protein
MGRTKTTPTPETHSASLVNVDTLAASIEAVGHSETWKLIATQHEGERQASYAQGYREGEEAGKRWANGWNAFWEPAGHGASFLAFGLLAWLVLWLVTLPWRSGYAYDQRQIQACAGGQAASCMDAVHAQYVTHGNQSRGDLLKSVYRSATGKDLPPIASDPSARLADYTTSVDADGNLTVKHKAGVSVVVKP